MTAPTIPPRTNPTVAEVLTAYLDHAATYYRKHGRPTGEAEAIERACRPLLQVHGDEPAANFGPRALKAIRRGMIDRGLARGTINQRIGRIVRCFKWAAGEELVPPSAYQGLAAVAGLRRHRTEARETEPVRPVHWPDVEAIGPHVAPQVWAMVRLQWHSGMRPGEVVLVRGCDLDRSADVWEYTPAEHKTEHHGRPRSVWLGPAAQEVLSPWLRSDPMAYLFSPAEAMGRRWAERRSARRSPMTPSQAARTRKVSPSRAPGDRYTTRSYCRAIGYGCRRAGVPAWHPNQLRHAAATRIRRDHGLEAACVILGHSSPTTTLIYAEADRSRAREVMAEAG